MTPATDKSSAQARPSGGQSLGLVLALPRNVIKNSAAAAVVNMLVSM
jgi:hypothetical protein